MSAHKDEKRRKGMKKKWDKKKRKGSWK